MIWAAGVYTVLGVYAAIGLVFALWFVVVGAARLDQSAEAMPLRVRLLILPGSVALWPFLLVKLTTLTRRPS